VVSVRTPGVRFERNPRDSFLALAMELALSIVTCVGVFAHAAAALSIGGDEEEAWVPK
jgi:hypothetical protein